MPRVYICGIDRGLKVKSNVEGMIFVQGPEDYLQRGFSGIWLFSFQEYRSGIEKITCISCYGIVNNEKNRYNNVVNILKLTIANIKEQK